jgi:hypothetical protein
MSRPPAPRPGGLRRQPPAALEHAPPNRTDPFPSDVRFNRCFGQTPNWSRRPNNQSCFHAALRMSRHRLLSPSADPPGTHCVSFSIVQSSRQVAEFARTHLASPSGCYWPNGGVTWRSKSSRQTQSYGGRPDLVAELRRRRNACPCCRPDLFAESRRRRNACPFCPRRDNQVDGAPRVRQAPDGERKQGSFLDAIGHRSHASENPPKFQY